MPVDSSGKVSPDDVDEDVYVATYNALVQQEISKLRDRYQHHDARIARGTADTEDIAAADMLDTLIGRLRGMFI